MLRNKINTLAYRYNKRVTVARLKTSPKDITIEKYTQAKGEAYEYIYVINQLINALDYSSNDASLSYFIEILLHTEQRRESSFRGSSRSEYTNAPEHEGRVSACSKIIQDLKGALTSFNKTKEVTPPLFTLRNLIICKE
jgi:hypothetical protein